MLREGGSLPKLKQFTEGGTVIFSPTKSCFLSATGITRGKNGSCFACRQAFSKLHVQQAVKHCTSHSYTPCQRGLPSSLVQTAVSSNLVYLVHPALSPCGVVGSWKLFPVCPGTSKMNLDMSFSHGLVPYLANQLSNL